LFSSFFCYLFAVLNVKLHVIGWLGYVCQNWHVVIKQDMLL